VCDIKVDMVRQVIDTAYLSDTKVMYCFADADNMRNEAKNAMLKITEEPPKNAYFCLTVQNDASLLDTIKSRAQVFQMQEYSKSEITKYAVDKYDSARKGTLKIISDICSVPGDVDLINTYDIQEFINYVNLVIDNISEVEPANAFKSSKKLSLKNTDDGYDLALFFKCFIVLCLQRNAPRYLRAIELTSQYLNDCYKVGINRQQLYDSWVFELRSVWI
jgi:hypothetical protein